MMTFKRRISPQAMARAGWSLEYKAPPGTKGDVWIHRDGWRLEHCGHPTALRPWALSDADDVYHRAPCRNNWDTLAAAVAYVEERAPTFRVVAVYQERDGGGLELVWRDGKPA